MSMPLIDGFAVPMAAKCEVFFLRKHISRFVCASAGKFIFTDRNIEIHAEISCIIKGGRYQSWHLPREYGPIGLKK